MTELSRDNRHVRIPLTISLVVSLAGAFIAWGVNANRLATLERRSDNAETIARAADEKIAAQSTRVAVVEAQFNEIIRRLDRIERKVEK